MSGGQGWAGRDRVEGVRQGLRGSKVGDRSWGRWWGSGVRSLGEAAASSLADPAPRPPGRALPCACRGAAGAHRGAGCGGLGLGGGWGFGVSPQASRRWWVGEDTVRAACLAGGLGVSLPGSLVLRAPPANWDNGSPSRGCKGRETGWQRWPCGSSGRFGGVGWLLGSEPGTQLLPGPLFAHARDLGALRGCWEPRPERTGAGRRASAGRPRFRAINSPPAETGGRSWEEASGPAQPEAMLLWEPRPLAWTAAHAREPLQGPGLRWAPLGGGGGEWAEVRGLVLPDLRPRGGVWEGVCSERGFLLFKEKMM